MLKEKLFNENRDIEETLNIGWRILSILPESELTRIDPAIIKNFHPKHTQLGTE